MNRFGKIKVVNLTSIFLLIVLVAVPLSSLITKVKAASLTNVTVTPASLNTSTAANVVITFTPVTTITTGSIVIFTYDTAFTGGASVADADITITGTNITAETCTGFIAGYFRCTLTTSAGVTTAVTATIGNNKLTTPSSVGNYSWSVSVDIGGAGTTFDSGAGLAYIGDENDVDIRAYVPPVLALDLYQTGTSTLLSNPNTCNLGVLSFNAVNTCSYDIGVGTNNASGATIRVMSDGHFTNGTHNFTQAGDTAIVAGTEEYGFRISSLQNQYLLILQTLVTQQNTKQYLQSPHPWLLQQLLVIKRP